METFPPAEPRPTHRAWRPRPPPSMLRRVASGPSPAVSRPPVTMTVQPSSAQVHEPTGNADCSRGSHSSPVLTVGGQGTVINSILKQCQHYGATRSGGGRSSRSASGARRRRGLALRRRDERLACGLQTDARKSQRDDVAGRTARGGQKKERKSQINPSTLIFPPLTQVEPQAKLRGIPPRAFNPGPGIPLNSPAVGT